MEALNEAKRELESLVSTRSQVENDLAKAIEDADADAIIKSRRELTENSIRQYAQRSRIMRLEKQEHMIDREQAFDERAELEQLLNVAAKEYDQALAIAEQARIKYQTIGLQLGSLDSRIENDRQAIGDYTKRLGEHMANWKRDSMIDQLAGESVCDY
jgi:hypothetical protein